MTNTTNEAAKNVAFELFERRLREQELVLSALEGHVEAAKAAKAKGEGVKNVRDRLNRMIAAGTGADEAFDEAFDHTFTRSEPFRQAMYTLGGAGEQLTLAPPAEPTGPPAPPTTPPGTAPGDPDTGIPR